LRSIVVEDEEELGMLDAIADRVGRTARVLLRIAPSTMEPGFAVRLAGRPSQFGIDEERVPSLLGEFDAWPRLRLAGFHVYSGTQCLDDEALARHFTAMWRTFRSAAEQSPAPVDEFVFGAGAGIPYHDGDGELTLQALGPAASTIAAEMDAVAPGARPYVELGRYLVGEAGLFVTRVVRTKASRGLDFLLCDGGMNHNLGACGHLGGVSHRHYPIRNLSASERSPERTYRVVGPLCTAIDTLALRIELPTTNAGDLLGVGCSGAYGPTASPLFFISHAAPREVWWNEGAEPELLDTSWLPELSPTGEGRP
jgi:diaminopimelate decarboxylase